MRRKILRGERIACARAQRCERTGHVVGTVGRSLWLRAYSAREEVGRERLEGSETRGRETNVGDC